MFEQYIESISDAYSILPVQGAVCTRAETLAAWSMLAADSVERAAGVRLLIDVQESDCPEPYADAIAMCEDIDNGRFVVSRANSAHPMWSTAQNVAFRIVHDVLGHYAASVERRAFGFGTLPMPWGTANTAGFDWAGENAACLAHARLLPTEHERRALFTECLAQTAYAINTGEFGAQKVGDVGPLLPDAPGLRGRYIDWLSGRLYE